MFNEKITTEFMSFSHQVSATFDVIRTEQMFGDFGIYHRELMLGPIVEDTIYLQTNKVDSY